MGCSNETGQDVVILCMRYKSHAIAILALTGCMFACFWIKNDDT